jgi:mono/diheme cytochrome c family protein
MPAWCTPTSGVLFLLALCLTGAGLVTAQQPAPEVPISEEERAALMEAGEAIFSADCAVCHGAEGSEGAAPALAGNASLANKEHVIRQVLEGTPVRGMPPFAQSLDDRKVAAVSTFIRNAWDNAHGVVLEADAKRLRQQIDKKK